MKKIIVAIIRLIMPNAVRKHEREEKARRIHNANVMQSLLDNEHEIRDKVNSYQNIPSTTKKALIVAHRHGMSNYSSFRALMEADFR